MKTPLHHRYSTVAVGLAIAMPWPVLPEMIKPGTPVKVFYTKVGDTLMASKVEVQSSAGLPKPPLEDDSSSLLTPKRTVKP